MAIAVTCPCGRQLKAGDRFAGSRAECPFCGRSVLVPVPESTAAGAGPSATMGNLARAARARRHEAEDAAEIQDFFDPPAAEPAPTPARPPRPPVLRRMFEALLDPRSIQWLLMVGGVLAVIGFIVWFVSLGVFEDPRVLAVALAAGTLALLGTGWWATLKTKYKTAGRALTFLACVVAPLNLWFYHAQNLVSIDGHLWIAAAVCCLLYAATVVVLRDPLFIYAIEAGVTLTVLLLLADLGRIADPVWLSLVAMVLGLISLHAERAFPPEEENEFSRRRFGSPLFHSAQVQIAASLLLLLAVQLFGWFYEPIALLAREFGFGRTINPADPSRLLAAGLWLAGAYAYVYSDLVIRRTGRDIYSAAFCLVMAELTFLLQADLRPEWLIAALALTALAANGLQLLLVRREGEAFDSRVPRIGMGLNALPLVLGFALHVRATWQLADLAGWAYETGWAFVAAMAVVAACNRLAAWLYRETAPRWAAAYLALTAAALVIGAAGLLRVFGLTAWSTQAPLLMLIPLLYLGASHLWRGWHPERPLYWIAQGATAVILAHTLIAGLRDLWTLTSVQAETINLLLGVVFVEATLFYLAAAFLRRRGVNVYLAAATGCGAVWQFLGYFAVPGAWYGVIFAAVGLALLVVARSLGLNRVPTWREGGGRTEALRGVGLPAFQTGTGILLVAFFAAFMQGLGRLATGGVEGVELATLAATAFAAGAAALVSPAGMWRRVHTVAAVALSGLTFLTLNEFLPLTGWQKLEIFCVAVGILMLAAAHVARFRDETGPASDDVVGLGLWLGSLLATLPLLFATFYHRATTGPSLADELALVTVTVICLAAGLAWKTRATTFFGGGTLVIYLLVLITSLVYRPQVAMGAYLAVGGVLLFAAGVLLSIYREKLLSLPDQIAGRTGIFQVIDWK